MDFITSWPMSDGFDKIMVMVECFSKYATFIPSTDDCTAKESTQLFFKNMVNIVVF